MLAGSGTGAKRVSVCPAMRGWGLPLPELACTATKSGAVRDAENKGRRSRSKLFQIEKKNAANRHIRAHVTLADRQVDQHNTGKLRAGRRALLQMVVC